MGFTSQLHFKTVVMLIYRYIKKIWIIIVTTNFCTTYTIMKKYYPDEPVFIPIQLLINIIHKKNGVINTNKGKGK